MSISQGVCMIDPWFVDFCLTGLLVEDTDKTLAGTVHLASRLAIQQTHGGRVGFLWPNLCRYSALSCTSLLYRESSFFVVRHYKGTKISLFLNFFPFYSYSFCLPSLETMPRSSRSCCTSENVGCEIPHWRRRTDSLVAAVPWKAVDALHTVQLVPMAFKFYGTMGTCNDGYMSMRQNCRAST